jgi:transporter family-2 protein
MNKVPSELLWVVLIGLIGGAAVGFQGPMLGAMSQKMGPIPSTFIIHVGGTITAGAILLLARDGGLTRWREVPPAYLFAGIAGIVVHLALSFTLPRVGATTSTLLLIAAQLMVALVLDHFGWIGVPENPVSVWRVAGVVLVLVGAYLTTR